MEALPAPELPAGPVWQYEPKWDGFRCLAFRDGAQIDLESKSGKPLTRYFPELVAALAAMKAKNSFWTGKSSFPIDGNPSFDRSTDADSPRGQPRFETQQGNTFGFYRVRFAGG